MKNKEPFTDASNFEAPLGHRVSLDFEEPFLSAEPEVYSRVLKDTEKFIIFGSGGFWKKITIKEAAYIVNTRPRNVCILFFLTSFSLLGEPEVCLFVCLWSAMVCFWCRESQKDL